MDSVATEDYMCEVHQGKELDLVCTACNKVMCSHCKKSGHHGHPVIDVKKYATQIRDVSSAKKDEVDKKITEVGQWRYKHKLLRQDFDLSVKHTKENIKFRGDLLIDWVIKHVQKKVAAVDRFAAQNGRQILDRDVNDGGKLLKALRDHNQKLSDILHPGTPEVKVVLLHTAISDEQQSAPYTSLAAIPEFRSHVYLPDTYLVQWKQRVRSFVGFPGIAQTHNRLTRRSKLAVALYGNCSADPKAEILGLHMLRDGRLCVAVLCHEPELSSKPAVHLKVLDVTGKRILQDTLLPFVHKKIRFTESLTGHQVVAASVYTGETKIIDLVSDAGDDSLKPAASPAKGSKSALNMQTTSKVYAFKRELSSSGRGLKLRRESATKNQSNTVYDVSSCDDSSNKGLFSMHVEDPQTVAADSSGQFFGVIQIERKVDSVDRHISEIPSVVVFRNPRDFHQRSKDKDVEPMFPAAITDRKNFFPADICFYYYKLQKEMIVVADVANNALYKLDYQSVGPVLDLLMAGSPLLDAPTALTTDLKGRLIVGCKGGSIVTLVASEDVLEGDYEKPVEKKLDDSSECEDEDVIRGEEEDDDIDDEALFVCKIEGDERDRDSFGDAQSPDVQLRESGYVEGDEMSRWSTSPTFGGYADRHGSCNSSSGNVEFRPRCGSDSSGTSASRTSLSPAFRPRTSSMSSATSSSSRISSSRFSHLHSPLGQSPTEENRGALPRRYRQKKAGPGSQSTPVFDLRSPDRSDPVRWDGEPPYMAMNPNSPPPLPPKSYHSSFEKLSGGYNSRENVTTFPPQHTQGRNEHVRPVRSDPDVPQFPPRIDETTEKGSVPTSPSERNDGQDCFAPPSPRESQAGPNNSKSMSLDSRHRETWLPPAMLRNTPPSLSQSLTDVQAEREEQAPPLPPPPRSRDHVENGGHPPLSSTPSIPPPIPPHHPIAPSTGDGVAGRAQHFEAQPSEAAPAQRPGTLSMAPRPFHSNAPMASPHSPGHHGSDAEEVSTSDEGNRQNRLNTTLRKSVCMFPPSSSSSSSTAPPGHQQEEDAAPQHTPQRSTSNRGSIADRKQLFEKM